MAASIAADRVEAIRPQPGPQTAFLSTTADIAIYGGAAGGGKTFSLLMEAARNVNVPGYSAVLFRRTYPQITNPGGMWDESTAIYANIGGVMRPNRLEWGWQSGARVVMRHMQYEHSKYDYQGSQIPLIGWDELTHFSETQFFYMLSRNRSMCGVRPYIRATTNPDSDSWVADFISWWIADDGYADMSRAGVIRWMIRNGEKILWFATREEAVQFGRESGIEYPDPKSVTFIPACVRDNKILLRVNPSYLSNLMALPTVERQRLLGDAERGGNWHVKAGGTKFKREWFKIVPRDAVPEPEASVRFWDMASTEVSSRNKDPDYMAGVRIDYAAGVFYIVDVKRGRMTPASCETLIRQTAVLDGVMTRVRMEQEAGASGVIAIDLYRKILRGFQFEGRRSTGSKEIRASPLSAAAENGKVRIVDGDWNGDFLDELESFPMGSHDDQVDGADGAYNEIVDFVAPVGLMSLRSGSVEAAAMAKVDAEIEKLLSSMTPEERLEADRLLRESGHL